MIDKLQDIFNSYWQEKGWKSPSKEWGFKLTLLLQESIVVLTDIIEQSSPFFNLPEIQKEGLHFLESNEIKIPLQSISQYLINQNDVMGQDKAKALLNELSKKHSIKKGLLMKSLRIAFFGCLSGPDLIQSWELLSEKEEDIVRINRCLDII